MRRSKSDLIKDADRFTGIDLDQSVFEKECNHYHRRLLCGWSWHIALGYVMFMSGSVPYGDG